MSIRDELLFSINSKNNDMPGPAVHYIIGQLLLSQTNKNDNYTLGGNYYLDEETRAALEAHQDYLNVGTLGPDFLFFNTKDWPYGENLPVRKIIELMNVISSIEHELKKMFPVLTDVVRLKKEIEETLGEVADAVIESSPTLSYIRTLLRDIKAISALIGAILSNAIKDFGTSNLNIFDLMAHPIQDCENKSDWWWFDILHYRRTGQFANYLLNHSLDNPKLLAYSMGYLSHVAGDTVGHPYVNNIVRGPYRTHSQRHKVVENFQDVSAFQQFAHNLGFDLGDNNLTGSNLFERFKFKDGRTSIFSGEVISETESLIDSMTPGIADVGMPEDLAVLFSNATKNVYLKDGKHLFGGGMKPEEVDAAYRLWFSWFKKSTSEIPLPKSLPDVPPLSEDIREAWEAFKSKLDDILSSLNDAINDLFSGNIGGSFSWNNIANFFKKIARVVNAAVAAAGAMINLIEEIVVGLPAKALHFLLDQIYQTLYCAYDYFRLSVSLNGFAFPNVNHLSDYKVQHMLDPSFRDSNGNILNPTWDYPVHKINTGNTIFRFAPQEAHLIYPPPDLEYEKVTPAPDSYSKQRHEYYINQDILFDQNTYNRLGDPNYVNSFQTQMKSEKLGNALLLTAKYWKDVQNRKKIPDLNLDGDRGIGFPSWEKENCNSETGFAGRPFNVEFKD